MNYLNAQQLAFVLDIKKDDARVKMVNAWCKHKGVENKLERIGKKIFNDDYPLAVSIEVLSKELNLPTLQDSVNDIVSNFLVRPASKKWILCDYPEKQIAKSATLGEDKKLAIPPGLKSLLPKEMKEKIINEWSARFPKAKIQRT